ncbi:alpha-ketoglutarate-dependent dioxygenase AlkB [Pseudomonadales bacterium]|nr:alpha-ketoglutarate-dependent dioxygenase AlkB [Pseudomonadales bacterium]MDB4529013.1 alpha-ketoglutarate-dependent dioxygenase AlkB [Pseudomonadales bacterium]
MAGKSQCITNYDSAVLPDANVDFFEQFYSSARAQDLFDLLLKELQWQQESLQIYGKRHRVPRLSALYGASNVQYTYSGIVHTALPWTSALLEIKNDLEQATQAKFNSVLANLYRNGRDSNGWHADDEPELGSQPIIASVSLGATRDFQFKHRQLAQHSYTQELSSGSLLVMGGAMQAHWLHQLPKRLRVQDPRINLTFRYIHKA